MYEMLKQSLTDFLYSDFLWNSKFLGVLTYAILIFPFSFHGIQEISISLIIK